jgi:hypothetical protein
VILWAISTMAGKGLIMRGARACTIPAQPRNILTKSRAYTISLFKE